MDKANRPICPDCHQPHGWGITDAGLPYCDNCGVVFSSEVAVPSDEEADAMWDCIVSALRQAVRPQAVRA